MENISIKTWNIESMTGYKPRTTFYEDFSIADNFGASAVRDTYCRAFNAWQNNIEYMTELVMVLNWKIWENHSGKYMLAEIYEELWRKAEIFIEGCAWVISCHCFNIPYFKCSDVCHVFIFLSVTPTLYGGVLAMIFYSNAIT